MRFVPTPETFVVEEIPAYEPSGEGTHTFVWIEKQGLSTPEAVKRLARAIGVQDRDVGYAGLKDRHAVTRQWLSLPGVAPEVAKTAQVEGLVVLEARRHPHKLRTGHLRGNRFEVVLEGVGAGDLDAVRGRIEGFARGGLPNRYGAQRFGAARDNVAAGIALLRGERRERDGRKRRLLLSAVQSEVFNRVLARRLADGTVARVLPGDVLQKRASGGLFVTPDPTVDQARVDAGEVGVTGPLPGPRETAPPPDSEVGQLEAAALAELGLEAGELERWGRELPGARRPLLVALTLGEPAVEDLGDGRARLRFALPSGCYATVAVEEILGVDHSKESHSPQTDPSPDEPAGESREDGSDA